MTRYRDDRFREDDRFERDSRYDQGYGERYISGNDRRYDNQDERYVYAQRQMRAPLRGYGPSDSQSFGDSSGPQRDSQSYGSQSYGQSYGYGGRDMYRERGMGMGGMGYSDMGMGRSQYQGGQYQGGYGQDETQVYTTRPMGGMDSRMGMDYGDMGMGRGQYQGSQYQSGPYQSSQPQMRGGYDMGMGRMGMGGSYGGMSQGSSVSYDAPQFQGGQDRYMGQGYGQQSYGQGMGNYGTHQGKGPKGYQRSDDRIKEMVSDALEESHDVDASNIDVQVSGGEVTLTGTVSDRMQKRRAEECVEHLRGVKDVHNQLRVQGENHSGMSAGMGSSMSGGVSSSNTSGSTSGTSSVIKNQ